MLVHVAWVVCASGKVPLMPEPYICGFFDVLPM